MVRASETAEAHKMVRASDPRASWPSLGPNAAAEDDSNGFGNGFSKALKRRFYKFASGDEKLGAREEGPNRVAAPRPLPSCITAIQA